MIFLNQKLFLPPYGIVPSSCNKFNQSDSKKKFLENLRSADRTWEYRSNPIEYKVNSNGYRSAEWEDVNWTESIVLLGCSHVFGEGLHFKNTIGEQLSILMNRPVINLGACSSAMDFSFYNSLILKKHYPTPWAVVHLWSGYDRLTLYKSDRETIPLGPWEDDLFFKRWVRFPDNSLNHSAQFPYISRLLWSDIKYYEASFFEETSLNYDCDFIPYHDFARDLSHPGKFTAKETALIIQKNLIS